MICIIKFMDDEQERQFEAGDSGYVEIQGVCEGGQLVSLPG